MVTHPYCDGSGDHIVTHPYCDGIWRSHGNTSLLWQDLEITWQHILIVAGSGDHMATHPYCGRI